MLLNNSDFHLPYNQKLVAKAKELRKKATIPEQKLWQEYLRFLKPRFLRQRPIDNFIVDFYCASCQLVIEIDGDSHFTQEGQKYDFERTKILEGYGLTVVRFTNDQVMNHFERVCAEIERSFFQKDRKTVFHNRRVLF
ncbi:endonuclease domain-containing protein [Cylindrospermopsis raciborskii]|nr:endonuclease domain-containing protein [Cylindrospermopsis raciborskii]MCZ2207812.1 endonuclease domain-containing protein [Cylindrospermopsis raciborskii PAMP2011]